MLSIIDYRFVEKNGILISFSGKINLGEGVEVFKSAIDKALDVDGRNRIIVDLGAVLSVDSAGLGALICKHQLLEGVGGKLVLLSPSKHVSDHFHITHLDAIFNIEDDEAAAIASFIS